MPWLVLGTYREGSLCQGNKISIAISPLAEHAGLYLCCFIDMGKKINPNSNCWETLHHLPCTISSSIQQRKSLHLLPCSCKLMLTSLQAGQLRLLFGTRDKPKFMTSVLFNLPYSVLLLNWAHFTLSISSEGQNRPCSNLQRCLMKTQALISWARL